VSQTLDKGFSMGVAWDSRFPFSSEVPMRHPSVAMAVATSIAALFAPATPAAEQSGSVRKSGGAESSTGLLIAGAAESAGAKLALTKAAGGNGGGNAGGNSAVPPGRRCDPNDPRPGCQPLPKSPKK
jgi:hypothetical protein